MSTLVRPCRSIAAVVAFTLALSLLFFAPRLWLMCVYVPGSFQWDRAHTFLLQCELPMRRDIEPAMFWRLLPPLVANVLHLPGKSPLALPWLGVISATAYVAVLLRRHLDDLRFVFGGTLLFTTTSAVLVPFGWFGMNDAWVWLGLLAVAFGRARWALPAACLLCPWIDERFIIGFTLAWLVARLDRCEPIFGRALLHCLWLVPYTVLRLWLSRHDAGAATSGFLRGQLQDSIKILPLVPLGWWMGLRVAWGFVGYVLWSWPRGQAAFACAVLLGTLGVSVLLASDLSRSVAIITPLVLAGCFALARCEPQRAPSWLLALGVANLVIPAAHMSYMHIDPISPLPLELFRLLR